jgi:hypothetical protein
VKKKNAELPPATESTARAVTSVKFFDFSVGKVLTWETEKIRALAKTGELDISQHAAEELK